MQKKIQILTIHGGMTFKSEKDYLLYLRNKEVSTEKKVSWAGEYLEKTLGKKFEIISPRMPLPEKAAYRDWKIVFERYIPLLKKEFILIGTSLGGVFLAKYLSENKLPIQALATCLVCPPFDNSLPGEDLVGGFALNSKSNLSLLEQNSKHLHLLFSNDDEVVTVTHAEKYRRKLTNPHVVIYKNKNGHFKVTTFPEIIKMIQADTKGL
jgi:predicted alpha/beta hydrolase family esterase